MEHRILGRTGVQVSKLCLGTMMFGAWGNTDHDDSTRIIHGALDAGINFVDTADVYSAGESEEIVGKALKGRRDDVVLATKVHFPMGDEPNHRGNSRRWIVTEVENSLRRLQTDWIDLYQIHRPEPDTDIDETLGALSDLVHQGKIRYFGHSTFPASEIVEAQWTAERRGRERFRCEQPPYSMLTRAIEFDVLPTSQRYGMGVIPWSPLAGGWLSGLWRKDSGQLTSPPGGLRERASPNRYDLSLPANQRKLDVRRGACSARRADGDHADRDGDRVRDAPPGGDRADHRSAHDGAPRVTADGRRRGAVGRCPRPDRTRLIPRAVTINPRRQWLAGRSLPPCRPRPRRR